MDEKPSRNATAMAGVIYDYAILPTVIFTAQKLFGAITWSWRWVLSPLWISAAIFAVVFLAGSIFALLNRGGEN